MERLRTILKKIFILQPLPTILIAVPSFGIVIYVLVEEMDGLLAYLSYTASAYALIISITGLSHISQLKRALQQKINDHPLTKKLMRIPVGERFLKDVKFRTQIFLYQGFFINLLYIVMKMVLGIYYRSTWFISVAIYYILLAIMRFLLLRGGKKKADRKPMEEELHRYRLCGIMLLMMNQALAGIVIFVVHQNRGYEYPGLLIYAMAVYSFYAMTIAVINLVKFRKHGSPVLSAAKAINLVAAMVSILSLETAMISQFGGSDDSAFRQAMTGATGGGVCTIVLGMAIYMIVKSSKDLKMYKINNLMQSANEDK